MAGLQDVLAFLPGYSSSKTTNAFDDIFPFDVSKKNFVETDVQNIYTRILTAVVERTEGISEEDRHLLWDNCLASESNDGLVTMIAKAMTAKSDLFIVYDPGIDLIRRATTAEQQKIADDYRSKNSSETGVYITFKNYTRTDMVRIYSALDYLTVASLTKQMNVSKAVQIKINAMRGDIANSDKAAAERQASQLAQGLREGKDIATDAKDMIELAKPDLSATNASVEFITKKLSFYLGLPASWITGESAKGLGDSGVGEGKAIERGLKSYFASIVKPVVDAIFDIKTTFKSEDFMQLSTALEALKTFEITSDELVSQENKRIIINKLLGQPPETKGDPPAAPPALPPPAPPAQV